MKLSDYAKKLGIGYRAAWDLYKNGHLQGFQLPTGTIIITQEDNITFPHSSPKVVTYARVSSSENKDNLEKQSERLKNYCSAKGYVIYKEVKEIGSGVNDNRKQLNQLFSDNNYTILIVEHKDRLTRFGFNYIDILMQQLNKKIEVINEAENGKEDIVQDFVSIITSFCAKIYGNRRCKRKTEKIIEELNNND